MAKSRAAIFVLNNPYTEGRFECPEEVWPTLRARYGNSILYLTFCLEEGDGGTKHFQGYAQFRNPVGLVPLAKVLKNAHVERAHGTPQENKDYIWRTGKHADKGGLKDGPWEFGEMEARDEPGKRNDLVAAAELHFELSCGKSPLEADAEVAIAYPSAWMRYSGAIRDRSKLIMRQRGLFKMREPPEVIWFFGPTATGKTRRVYEIEGANIDVVLLSGDRHAPFMNNYLGGDVLLLDDLRPEAATYAFFLRLLDRYELPLNVKGGSKPLVAKRIYVTTCLSPEDFASASGGVGEDPRQFTRRITKVVDFGRVQAAEQKAEVVDLSGDETEQERVFLGLKRHAEEAPGSPLKRSRARREESLLEMLADEAAVAEALEDDADDELD